MQSGMSLYERLVRNPLLYADLGDLLKDVDSVKKAKAFGPLQKRPRDDNDDNMPYGIVSDNGSSCV